MKMLKILCRSAIWDNITSPTAAAAAAAAALTSSVSDSVVTSLTCQTTTGCPTILHGLQGCSSGVKSKNLLPIIPTLAITLNRNLTTFSNIKDFSGENCQRSRGKVLDQNSKTLQVIRGSKRNMASGGGSSVKGNNTSSTKAASEDNTNKKFKYTNRLITEKSPYLLQHAHNPVDWYPWGDEAIQRARQENKLIFLSIGYSTCHWCHVMETESFENKAVADIMNQNFINIKVDREERPDIDRIYMHFVLMMTGSGGWPMSVWLTPDLAPISAGTYFPPYERWGTPSFATVLRTIANKWTANEDHLKSTGIEVIETIKKSLSEKPALAAFKPGTCDARLSETLLMLEKRFDSDFGGFTSHPKFPEVSRLNLLFHAYIATKEDTVLNMALHTLKCIGQGGIHDHIFGGFSRYSVDGRWHVPHFEKMLYDQGQLMMAYATAYKLTGESIYLDYADGIYRYITTDLQHPKGGFYAGEDADSLAKANDKQKVEGAFYAWTYDSIKAAVDANVERYQSLQLSRPSDAFEIYAFHYNLQPTGNVHPSSDPHGHLNGKNILMITGNEQKTCEQFDISDDKLKRLLNTTNDILHNLRNKRPRPHLDTKIICSWNGLVLSGLSALANCNSPKRNEYLTACKKLIEFIHVHLYEEERRLKRSCYGVDVTDENALIVGQIDGFLDDYAFLIKGLLDYYTASLDQKVLQWAKTLQDLQLNQFWDNNQGAFYYSKENAHNVVVRLKDDHDGAEPCGNSVSARNLILLSHYFDDNRYKQRAAEIFQYFADQKSFGYTLPEMMSALLLYANGLDLVAVVGPDNELTKRMVQICRSYYIPGIIILHIDPQAEGDTNQQRNAEKFKMVNDHPTVYICTDKICRMPLTDIEQLEQTLKQSFFRRKVLNRNQVSE